MRKKIYYFGEVLKNTRRSDVDTVMFVFILNSLSIRSLLYVMIVLFIIVHCSTHFLLFLCTNIQVSIIYYHCSIHHCSTDHILLIIVLFIIVLLIIVLLIIILLIILLLITVLIVVSHVRTR